ncbi:MAG: DegV family protein [Dehalococcoidia bacterium]|nr:DegV family protein [Dehalococcoidia bacterium]MDW8009426.1 DegV family protein [Chloroflexota bacterium]
MPVKIVTDSTADLPPELVRELDIAVVPLTVVFGDRAYKEGIDIDHDTFYRLLQESKTLPTTSAPSVGEMLQAYEEVLQEADELVCIHISSKLSATYNNACRAAEALRERGARIEVVDSLSVSMGMGFIVLAAARAARGGASMEQVLAIARHCVDRVRLYFVLDTLEYLRRGGRIGRARAFLGSLLHVKPILSLRDGEVHPEGRVRTRQQARERLLQLALATPRIKEMAIGYTTDRAEAEALLERVRPMLSHAQPYLVRIGPVVGTHAGPGLLGVGTLEGEE